MGYMSTIETEHIKLKPEHSEKFIEMVEFCKENEPTYLKGGDEYHPDLLKIWKKFPLLNKTDYLVWHLAEIDLEHLKQTDCITYEETTAKWYGDKELVWLLAPLVECGELKFYGEDGVTWGFRFDGKGNVYELQQIWVESAIPMKLQPH